MLEVAARGPRLRPPRVWVITEIARYRLLAMRSHRRAVLALLALLAGGVVLDATVVVPMDLRELVVQAPPSSSTAG